MRPNVVFDEQALHEEGKRSNNILPLLLIFQHNNYHKCYKLIVNHIPNLVRVIIYIDLNMFFFVMV